MFRGASALECEVTEAAEFDTVTDEIGRWSSLLEDESSGLSRMVY